MISKLSRREFLKRVSILGSSSLAWGLAPLNSNLAWGTTPPNLLVINFNGGSDGPGVLQPSSGVVFSTLLSLRSTLCLDPSALLNTSDGYGFHPSVPILKSLYDESKLSCILNVGVENMSRSHLDAEVAIARGVSDRLTSANSSGFLGRIGDNQGWSSGLEIVSPTGSDRAFEGATYRGVQANSLSTYKYKFSNGQTAKEAEYRADNLYQISQLWQTSSDNPRIGTVLSAIDLASNTSDLVQAALSAVTFQTSYPSTTMGRSLSDAEVLLSDQTLGTRIAYARFGGFDTHSAQATALTSLLSQFNAAFTVFVSNMKARGLWNNLIVLIVSEFGRTNKENGSLGTDHGGANTFFVTGGLSSGGIFGEITSTDLTGNGWLPVKYNLVEVYRQVLQKMNLDPDAIVGDTVGPSLNGILT